MYCLYWWFNPVIQWVVGLDKQTSMIRTAAHYLSFLKPCWTVWAWCVCFVCSWPEISSKHTSSHLLNLSFSTHTHTHREREKESMPAGLTADLFISLSCSDFPQCGSDTRDTPTGAAALYKCFITSFSSIKALLRQLKRYIVLCKVLTIFLVYLNDKSLIYCTVLLFFLNETILLSLVL